MFTPTAETAIAAALSYNWKESIRINTLLIKENKNDIAALNRLGYAYAQNGQKTLAKATFEKVLKLDAYNQIALKHIKNLGSIKKKGDPMYTRCTPCFPTVVSGRAGGDENYLMR